MSATGPVRKMYLGTNGYLVFRGLGQKELRIEKKYPKHTLWKRVDTILVSDPSSKLFRLNEREYQINVFELKHSVKFTQVPATCWKFYAVLLILMMTPH